MNKGNPQDLSHILFIGKVLPPITLRATISPISLSSSSNVTVQLLFSVTRCASEVVDLKNILQRGLVEKDAERRKRTAAYDAGCEI